MPGPPVPAPSSGLNEVLRRLGINLPMPQSPEEAKLARTGGVAHGIGDIGKFLGGLVTGPNMRGPVDATDLGGVLSLLAPVLGKIVYHGSPHVFEKFDLSKVGTGEGAQAYGHGLYFADSPGVAKSYRRAGTGSEGDVFYTRDGRESKLFGDEANVARSIKLKGVEQALSDLDAEIARLRRNDYAPDRAGWLESLSRYWRERDPNMIRVDQGTLYDVDLPDDAIAKMLDWDAPLSQQAPEVQAALEQLSESVDMFRRWKESGAWPHVRGEQLYRELAGDKWPSGGPRFSGKQNQPQATATLREKGIPGIRYLDGSSRKAGEGSRNYVVFDDQLPKIVNVQR